MAIGEISKKGEASMSIQGARHFYLTLSEQYKDKKMILK